MESLYGGNDLETEAVCLQMPSQTDNECSPNNHNFPQMSLSERLRICNQEDIADRVYPMNSHTRGEVFILNVSEYQNGNRNPRPGSENDVVRLEETWKRLGHKVHVHHNLTKNAFETEFLEFLRNRNFLGDCCTVFIMTHGEADEDKLDNVEMIMYDDETVSTDWIFEQLKSDNIIHLATKVKMVFFNTCRGQNKDIGVFSRRIVSWNRANALFLPPPTMPESDDFEYIPDYANILIVYPCSPGCVALRDTQDGSLFIQTLISVLCANARSSDIQSILQSVGRILLKLIEMDPKWGHQTVCTKTVGFNKKLYLNPPSDFNPQMWD